MSKSFSVSPRLLAGSPRLNLKDPRVLVRAALAVLVLANVVAALLAFKPWGGSAEDLARQQVDMQQRLASMQTRLAKTKALVAKAERARKEGDGFLTQYTTDRQHTFSTIFAELERVAREAGVQPRPVSYELDQVEGSDSLYQMDISAAYEGSYTDLTKFVNLLDKSPRFLIIESLMAAPQQSNAGDLLSVSIKLDTFVREQPGNPI
ncbi:MAG: type 4a pilus biogenesis protein PilO [Bryobacteraceae bacterium]|jgi:type IV pilus assembly protein PilO